MWPREQSGIRQEREGPGDGWSREQSGIRPERKGSGECWPREQLMEQGVNDRGLAQGTVGIGRNRE